MTQTDTESKTLKKSKRGVGGGQDSGSTVHIIQMCGDRGESVDAGHRVQQGHVLGPIERQTLSAVMVHHLGDAGEDAAALVQGVAVFLSLSHDDVDAALARPNSHRREEEEEKTDLPTAAGSLSVDVCVGK